MSNGGLVGVVILNWNRPKDTMECVRSVSTSEYKNHRIIVVDNGSTDGSPEEIQKTSLEIELLTNAENQGFAAGVNVGIRRALQLGAEYVLILNNDALVAPKCLEELVLAAKADSMIGICVPKILHYYQPTRIWSAGAQWTRLPPRVKMRGFDKEDGLDYANMCDLDYATGCALLVRSHVFRVVGTFDPAYFMYQEDYDFCHRVRQDGFRIVYVPRATVWHKVSQSLGENSYTKRYLWSRSTVLFYNKHFSLFKLVGFIGWVGLREALKLNMSFFRPFVHGIYDGMRAQLRKH